MHIGSFPPFLPQAFKVAEKKHILHLKASCPEIIL